MSTPGKRWRHVIINTRCSWLHGDERGFRNRQHRIHSNGDYMNPPPADEHAGLRIYHEQRSGDPIEIPMSVRESAGRAVIRKLRKCGYSVLALAVSPNHLHALVELPDGLPAIRFIIGRCKRDATEARRPTLTGRVEAEGGEFKRIKDRSHHQNAYKYILTKQGRDAWTWSYRDEFGLPRFPEGWESRKAGKDMPRAKRSGPSRSSGLGVNRGTERPPRPERTRRTQ